MPVKNLQERFEGFIIRAAEMPDGLAGFRGHKGETITVEPWMADALREAEARVRRLRRQVEDRLAGAEARQCARCRKPLTGRPDRKFCSDTCRQAAYQSRRGPKITDPASMAPSLRREHAP
jgi:hypothetical protein